MRIFGFATLAATLVVGTISMAQAGPRAKDVSPEGQARARLSDVSELAQSMTVAADGLAMDAKRTGVQDVELSRLEQIKDDINRIGKDLRTLENEEGALSEWERQAFDTITPLMVNAAESTDQAFKTYDSDKSHLWATAFPSESAEIYKDATKVNEIVGGYLKLAALHHRQQQLETVVGGSH